MATERALDRLNHWRRTNVHTNKTIRAVLAATLLLAFVSTAFADWLAEIKARCKLMVGVSDTAPRSASGPPTARSPAMTSTWSAWSPAA